MERSIGNTYMPTLQKSDIGSAGGLGGNAYIAEASKSFVDAFTDMNILGLQYNGSNYLYIDSIIVSTNSPYARVELYGYTNITVTGSTYIDTPTNLNFGSELANVTASTGESSSLTASFSPDNKLLNIQLSLGCPNYKYEFKGALILSNNENILLVGHVSGAGEYIQTSIVYSELPAGS